MVAVKTPELPHADCGQDGNLQMPEVSHLTTLLTEVASEAFELFWTAAGCAQCLPLSGIPLGALQTLKFEVIWADLQGSLVP